MEWPIVDKILNRKSHRIGLKQIILLGLGNTFKYVEYKNNEQRGNNNGELRAPVVQENDKVQDGVNVRKTNIMECDLRRINALLGRVRI